MSLSSIGGSTPPVSFSGLASGIDTTSIIQKMIQLDSAPMQQMQQQVATIQGANAAFQAIEGNVNSLQQAAFALTQDSTVKAMSATSSNSTVGSVSAGASASAGTYSITVNQLATASVASSTAQIGTAITNTSQLLSSANTTDPITTGTFTLTTTNSSGTKTAYQVNVGATDTWSSVFNSISTATGGTVTASLSGNKIVLTTASGITNLQMGSQGDTSNFLHETHLDTSTYNGATSSATSSQVVGVAQVNNTLQNSSLATALTGTSGDFKLNGVDITWDATTDTINSIIGKINTSNAGVSASYSAPDDKIILTSKATGSQSISMQDVTGNLLQAFNVNNSNQTVGQNASITVAGMNSGQPIYNTSNSFNNLISGVNFTASATGSTTVAVSNDTSTLVSAVQTFVSQFNSTIDAINSATAQGQPNAFDSDLTSLENQLYSMVSNPVSGLPAGSNDLSSLGISTSQTDRTHLSFNQATLTAAVQANPNQVAAIFQQTVPNPADPTTPTPQGVAAVINQYLFNAAGANGIFQIRQNATNSEVSDLNTQIQQQQDQLNAKQQQMQAQFTAMEVAISTMKNNSSAYMSQLGMTSSSSSM